LEADNKHIIFNNSDCVEKETLIEYKRDKLSSEQKHFVEQHLVDCELCSDALDGYMNATNIKLDVYELKLKVLKISERPQIFNIIYKNKHRLKVAAGILVFIGIFSLFIQFIKEIGTGNQNIAQRKSGELKNPNKIDYNYEIKVVSPNKENNEIVNEIEDSTETLPDITSLNDEEKDDVDDEIVIAEKENIEGDITDEETVLNNIAAGSTAQGNNEGITELYGQALISDDIDKTPIETIPLESEQIKEESSETSIAQTESKKKTSITDAPISWNSGLSQGTTNNGTQISRGDVIIGMNKTQLTKQMRTYYDNSYFLILTYTFEEYNNTIADDTELMFYAAYSYSVNAKNTKAIKFYNKVIESQDPYYKVEAKWHLAKKYIDLNNKEKAKPLLDELVSSNSRYKSQAKDELKKIKQRENKDIK